MQEFLPLLLGASGLAGVTAGFALGAARRQRVVRRAQRAAAGEIAVAREQVQRVAEEGEQAAAAQRQRLCEQLHTEVLASEADLAEFEVELDEREALADSRAHQLQQTEERLVRREGEVLATLEAANENATDAAEKHESCLEDLEKRAESSRADVLKRSIKECVGQHQLFVAKRVRRVQEQAEQDEVALARNLMAISVDRYNGVGHLERIQNTIPVADGKTLHALGSPPSPSHLVFKELLDCELHLDEQGGTVTVRGDDPLGREVSRRVVRQLANRSISSPDKVRNMVVHVQGEVQREVQNAARKAVRTLSLARMDPEIMDLVGRLKFRLSYSQNQWKHAIEVGYLAGMLAEEMGLDPQLARRGGLLHDIGKAMTHDHDGSHAVLGADVARRCGESEEVANAIASHHADEPVAYPVAYIVTAADALSGGRPGARRENAASYLTRIQDIHRIASAFPVVERVDIMHAGREVRVIVAGDERSEDADHRHRGRERIHSQDDDLQPLAQEIAQRLEQGVTFAGQIRVTVIRETRSVSVAF